ncbi:MAG: GGDEF domain-containing protein [Lachnospiraceae bacterium]|nr:GGDEF domain-containing protein [Lachnospiraceae bacterium]
MYEEKFVKFFRVAKIIQLIVLLIIEAFFFLILVCNPSIIKLLYRSKPIFLLCATIWVLMIFYLICLIYDFSKLRSFALESHALNKEAYLDDLTGIPNRHGLDVIFRTYDTPESIQTIGCYMVTIENLMSINDTLGRQTGDTMIQVFSSILEKVGDTFGIVGRNGGNEFICIINQCTNEIISQFTNCLNAEVETYNLEHSSAPIHLHSAYVLNSETQFSSFPELLVATYNKLYCKKNS